MWHEVIIRTFPLLIPIIALLIPLVVLAGRFVVEPLVQAITRLVEAQEKGGNGASALRLERVERRLESLEDALRPLVEERAFLRELEGGRKGPAAKPLAEHAGRVADEDR